MRDYREEMADFRHLQTFALVLFNMQTRRLAALKRLLVDRMHGARGEISGEIQRDASLSIEREMTSRKNEQSPFSFFGETFTRRDSMS